MLSFKRTAAVFVALCLLVAPVLLAQSVTTGTIAGKVTSIADKTALPGVTIEAVHVPTATHYTTVSGATGYYEIPNVRVGGPYTVSASLQGFKNVSANNIGFRLGETSEVPLSMELAPVTEAITVTATPD